MHRSSAFLLLCHAITAYSIAINPQVSSQVGDSTHDIGLSAVVERDEQPFKPTVEPGATWPLRVLSASKKLTPPVEDYKGNFSFIPDSGKGVDVYLLDSGVRRSHAEFRGNRVRNFNNLADDQKSPYCASGDMGDEVGHGTHLASLINGVQNGIAPSALVWNVKVNCTLAYPFALVDAIKDVTRAHQARVKSGDPTFRGSIINMSWGRKHTAALEDAIRSAKYSGISIFVAAGNDNADTEAVEQYPCGSPFVACIGGIDNTYRKTESSNWGKFVNAFAPGGAILGASHLNNNKNIAFSGTSQASAYAAGVAAVFTSWKALGDGTAFQSIKDNALEGVIEGLPPNTANVLVQTGVNNTHKESYEPFRWAGFYAGELQQGPFAKVKRDIRGPQPTIPGIYLDSTYLIGPPEPSDGTGSDPEKDTSPTRWRVDFFPSSIGRGCSGDHLSFNPGAGSNADGQGSKTCFQANPIKASSSITACINAQTFGGGNGEDCVLRLWKDEKCSSYVNLPNSDRGNFGQSQVDAHLVVKQATFTSWSVEC